MLRIVHVWRRELGASFGSPVALVSILTFVALQTALLYWIGYPVGPVPLPALWEGGQATLSVTFTWQPLLLAFLVPALSMGAWAEERRAGTQELLFTYPLRTFEVVVGKWLSTWTLVIAMLVLGTLPLAWTVGGLGDLDWGAVAAGLIGACGLAAAYCALALCCSALSSEQLVAFLVGALVLGVLWALRLLVPVLPPELAEPLNTLCPASHVLDSAARGVLDLRDGVYFASLVLVGLVLNTVLVERRRWA